MTTDRWAYEVELRLKDDPDRVFGTYRAAEEFRGSTVEFNGTTYDVVEDRTQVRKNVLFVKPQA